MKQIKKSNKKIVYICAIFLLICIFFYFSNNFIKTYTYTVTNEKLPDEFEDFRICVLSDLHDKEFGAGNNRLIDKIINESPDIIVCAGDMINSSSDGSLFLSLISKLVDIAPVYYVDGNHEHSNIFIGIYNPERENAYFYSKLEEYGVKIINDQKFAIEKNGQKINIYGLVLPLAQYSIESLKPEYTVSNLEHSFGKANKKEFNILVAHQPRAVNVYNEWGADLVLSGHVHGGLIKIPFKGGLLSPEREFFPEYYGGEYHVNQTTMILSHGLGNSNVCPRVFNRPDLTIVKLKGGE